MFAANFWHANRTVNTLTLKLALLNAALIGSCPSALAQATYTVTSTADAFLATGSPSNPAGTNLTGLNFGAAGALVVAPATAIKGEFQSVLKFDLTGASNLFNTTYGTNNWMVGGFSLQLSSNNGIAGTNADNPITDGITYNTLQSTYIGSSDQAAGTFSFNGASSGSATYPLTLGSALLNDIYNGNNVSTLLSAADSGVSMLVNSRSGGSSSSHPELIINVIPEPGSLTLVLLGLIMIVGTRWSVSRYCSR